MFETKARLSASLLLSGASFLVFLTAVGPVMDWFSGPAHILGRVNNIFFFYVVAMILAMPVAMSLARGTPAWFFSLVSFVAVVAATCYTVAVSGDPVFPAMALISMAGVSSAGVLAYGIALNGVDVASGLLRRLVWIAPCMLIPPVLVAIDPDAYARMYLRVYGYGNVRVFGEICMIAVLAVVVLSSQRGFSTSWRLGAAIVAPVAVWSLLFWSGTRASFVALMVALPVFFVLTRTPWSVVARQAGLGAVGALASLAYVTPGGSFGILSRIDKTARELTETTTGSGSDRSDLWMWAFGRILEHPFLGYGGFPMTYMKTKQLNFVHTHNYIIELMISFGIPVAVVLVLALGFVYARSGIAVWKRPDRNNAGLFAIATASLVSGLFAATMFFPTHPFLTAVAIGTILGGRRRRSLEPQVTGA